MVNVVLPPCSVKVAVFSISAGHSELRLDDLAIDEPAPHFKDELGKTSKKKTKPAFSKSNAVASILVSSADKSIYVIQNDDIVAQATAEIADSNKKLGSNVCILEQGDEDGFTWQATGYSTGKKAAKPSASVVERIKPPADVQAAIDERIKPGSSPPISPLRPIRARARTSQ
jgi:hypothetical protein